MERKKSNSGRIKIREHNRDIWIDIRDICYCRADGSYTHIFLKTWESHTKSENSKRVEERIGAEYFFRCHRSHILNLQEIDNIDIEKRIIYQKLYRIPVSKGKLAEFLCKWPFTKKTG